MSLPVVLAALQWPETGHGLAVAVGVGALWLLVSWWLLTLVWRSR